jgi:hypothetical protein
MTVRCEFGACREPAAWETELAVDGFRAKRTFLCAKCFLAAKPRLTEYSPFIEKKRINRTCEQVKCPTCKKVVLVPQVIFIEGDVRTKRRMTFCVQCGTIITLYIKIEGEIEVFRAPPVYIYPDIPAAVSATGIQPTTEIFIAFDPKEKKYVAAVGIAMMGATNFPGSVNACPFDYNFMDNAVRGRGNSPKEAVDEMVKDMVGLANGLWD